MLTHFIFILMLLLWCPYFSTGCCSPAELPPTVSSKSKSIQNCHVTREQSQYRMRSHRKHVKTRCVSKNPPSCRDKWTQQCAGSTCEMAFVSLITPMLLCVFHCPPCMSVTFCCPIKGNQHLQWADGSQRDCCPFHLHIGLCVNTSQKNAVFLSVVKACGLRCKRHCPYWVLNPEF